MIDGQLVGNMPLVPDPSRFWIVTWSVLGNDVQDNPDLLIAGFIKSFRLKRCPEEFQGL